jgi:membrane protein implicated in regulation of membrane protease activity
MSDQSPGQPPEKPSSQSGKARANREFRIAVAVAIPLLAVGQILLFTGLRWVALFGIALPGTVVALLLVRRWQAMERHNTT